MEFHMINITYAALHMCAQTEKTTFSCKDDCTMIKHTRRWMYSALQYFLTPNGHLGLINICIFITTYIIQTILFILEKEIQRYILKSLECRPKAFSSLLIAIDNNFQAPPSPMPTLSKAPSTHHTMQTYTAS